jgi:hypothetical protein
MEGPPGSAPTDLEETPLRTEDGDVPVIAPASAAGHGLGPTKRLGHHGVRTADRPGGACGGDRRAGRLLLRVRAARGLMPVHAVSEKHSGVELANPNRSCRPDTHTLTRQARSLSQQLGSSKLLLGGGAAARGRRCSDRPARTLRVRSALARPSWGHAAAAAAQSTGQPF